MNFSEKQNPPCAYFSKCGGCTLQDLLHYKAYKLSLAKEALLKISYNTKTPFHVSHNSRRRASFRVINNRLAFNQLASTKTVPITNCLLLEDQINYLILPINKLLDKLKIKIESLSITNSDTGIELSFKSNQKTDLEHEELLTEFANKYDIARIVWQNELIIQRKPVQLIFEQVHIDLPINSFLQVSKESLDFMIKTILAELDEKPTLELYSGCGSFTIPISTKTKVYAVEGNKESIDSIHKVASIYKLPIKSVIQDLYQNPIQADKINEYQQVVINPPRNGATPQVKQIALSTAVKKVIFISCSLNNFVRDAKILLNANFILEHVYLIDQFLYTTHLEIIGIFRKA